VLTADKLDQIIDAIVDGKYSWACVLLLRSHALNPLYYIPYRTYNRLLKENTQAKKQSVLQPEKRAQAILDSNIAHIDKKQKHRVTAIEDLPLIESAAEPKIRGGAMLYHSIYRESGLAISS
jgi:hypothetical protein